MNLNFQTFFNKAVILTKLPKVTKYESNDQSIFKILFYEIIDNILIQLNTRFQDTNKLLFTVKNVNLFYIYFY